MTFYYYTAFPKFIMKTRKTPQLSPPPNTKTISTATATCWIDEFGIAIFIAHGNQTLENAKENMAAYRQIACGKKTPALLDFSDIQFITREAREYYASEESSSLVLAIAIVNNSVIGKVIGNFFLGLNMNKVGAPVKLFTNVNEAKTWLRQFLN